MESFYIKCRALSARTATGEEEEEVEEGGCGGAGDVIISQSGARLYDKSSSQRGGFMFITMSCLITGFN